MATLKDKIVAVLKQNPKGIKAREIAYKIGVTRTDVNSFLYSHKSDYDVDENYCWTIKQTKVKISVSTSDKKVDPWHDTSNVRAINEELKKQRLERKKQAETTAAQKKEEATEAVEDVFDLTAFLRDYKPDPKIYPFTAKNDTQKHTATTVQIDYDEEIRVCRTCGKKFKLSQGEIEFYLSKNLCLPTHCRKCLDNGDAGLEYIREVYGVRSYSNFGHIPRKFGGPKN